METEIRGPLPILLKRVSRVLELHSRHIYRKRKWMVTCRECGQSYPCETRIILLGTLEENITDTGTRWFLTKEQQEEMATKKVWADCPTCKDNDPKGWITVRGIKKQCPTCHGATKVEVQLTRQKRPRQ